MIVICIKKSPNLTLGRKYKATIANPDYWTSSMAYTVIDDMGLKSVFSENYVKEVEEMRENKLKMMGI